MTSSFKTMFDLVIKNAKIHTMDSHNTIIEKGMIGINHKTISYIGPVLEHYQSQQIIDASTLSLTPGLIDCHTHLVYAGDRILDFKQRMLGRSYQEIAALGGGIWSTVNAIHESSDDALFDKAYHRITQMMKNGVTCIEIKSGYGLDKENELKILKIIKRLKQIFPIQIIPTFLGLHALPPSFAEQKEAYVDYVINEILPRVAAEDLAVFVDAFCEPFAFSKTQISRFFKAAKAYGFELKIHAEQLSNQKSALMANQLGAVSYDHLEFLNEADCIHLTSGVAVLLPGAAFFLRESQQPPVASLRQHHIPIAIATDCNPGTSPYQRLSLMMHFACILFGLTMDEVWRGVTINAAKALRLDHSMGSVELGKKANLVLWHTENIEEIIYQADINFCQTLIHEGAICYQKNFDTSHGIGKSSWV